MCRIQTYMFLLKTCRYVFYGHINIHQLKLHSCPFVSNVHQRLNMSVTLKNLVSVHKKRLIF